MAHTPLTSIVIPTYFRESVVEAVDSARNQTYERIEVIVVDDSGEAFAKPLVDEDDQVSVVTLDANRGSMEARRIGFELAGGEYIQFLDDDDSLRPSKIEHCLEVFSTEPKCPVVYTGLRFRNENVYPDPEVQGDVLAAALRFEMFPCSTSTMVIRSDALSTANAFQQISGGDDLQMMIELAQLGPFKYVDEILIDKGDPARSKGGSKASVEGRFTLLDRYADLYDQQPYSVYRTARSNAEFHRAKYHLSTDLWSANAILSMMRHCYWEPTMSGKCLLKILGSLFGRPGWRVSEQLYDKVSS